MLVVLGQKVLDKLFLLWGTSIDGWSGWSSSTPWLGDGNKDNGTQGGKRQLVGLERSSEDSVSGTHDVEE